MPSTTYFVARHSDLARARDDRLANISKIAKALTRMFSFPSLIIARRGAQDCLQEIPRKPLLPRSFRLPRLTTIGIALSYLLSMAPTEAIRAETASRTVVEDTDETARLYRTAAERREAGLKRQLTPWLTLSGLLELDGFREKFAVIGNSSKEQNSTVSATVQVGLNATPLEWLKGELVVEYGSESKVLFGEEAILSFDADPWELEAGIQYLPFGDYVSNFATGPILEFGETRAPAATISCGLNDHFDISTSLYRGRSRKLGSDRQPLGLALALQAWPAESLLFGLSYLSSLADSDARLLEDADNRYEHRVPGLGGFLVWTAPTYEISVEGIGAISSFVELDPDRNRPVAWNLEFVHFTHPRFELALRLEGSRELEDEPYLRFGAAATWRPQRRASITLEYLLGRYQGDLATSDQGKPYDHVHSIGAQFLLAF